MFKASSKGLEVLEMNSKLEKLLLACILSENFENFLANLY